MRSKLGTGALVAAVAFLLATNPLVADAAKQVTSGQIKNNTIKSKDIKDNQVRSTDIRDGSLLPADLSAQAVPVEVKAFKRFAGQPEVVVAPAVEPAFYGPTSQVTVDADDVVVLSASADVNALATGEDYSYGLCSRPAGSAAAPSPVGGPATMFEDIDALVGDNVASSDASAVLGAGTYTVGWCARAITGTITLASVSGWVQVLSGSTGGL